MKTFKRSTMLRIGLIYFSFVWLLGLISILLIYGVTASFIYAVGSTFAWGVGTFIPDIIQGELK